jgi:hypothetical protein
MHDGFIEDGSGIVWSGNGLFFSALDMGSLEAITEIRNSMI